jgi:hypothetical protein
MLQFFPPDHLMDIMAGHTIGRGDAHAIDRCSVDGIAQAISAGAIQGRSTVAISAAHPFWPEFVPFSLEGGPIVAQWSGRGFGAGSTRAHR